MSITIEDRDDIDAPEAGHVELSAGDVRIYLTRVEDTVSVVCVDTETDWQGSVVVEGDHREVREV